jgi:drug/metabolite transporter (DMT)-like permease
MTGSSRGIGFALLAASIYGLVPNIARMAFDQGIPALESIVVRTLFVTVVMGVATLVWKLDFKISASARQPLFLQVLATAMVSSCYIAAIQFIPVSIAVMVFFTFPVLIAILAPLAEHRAVSWLSILLAMLAFAGLVVALGPDWQSYDARGLLLAAFAAVGCALQFFAGRSMAGKLKPAPFAALVHLAVLPIVSVAMATTGNGTVQLLAPSTTAYTLLVVSLVGICYCAAYFFQMSSVAHAPASVVAPYFNIEPVVTTAVAMMVLGETMTVGQAIGSAMVLTAVVATRFLTPGELK